MGLEALAIGAGVGALGGAIKGAKGTAAVNRYVAPGAAENKLVNQAQGQYNKQLGLIDQQQAGLAALDPLRQQALQGYQGVLDGSAFQANQQDLSQIGQLRDAQIQLGTQDIQRLLGEATGMTNSQAGVRGLRGQALAQLQGQNTQQAAQQIGSVVNQANAQAAQMAIDNPYRRVAAQGQAMQTGLTYQDQLAQQAIQNRQLASNPALLSYYQGNRSQQGSLNTPKQGGGFLDGVVGGLSGAAAGAGAAGQALAGYGQYQQYANAGGGFNAGMVPSASQGLQTSINSAGQQDPYRRMAGEIS